jgi:hypothetical protein
VLGPCQKGIQQIVGVIVCATTRLFRHGHIGRGSRPARRSKALLEDLTRARHARREEAETPPRCAHGCGVAHGLQQGVHVMCPRVMIPLSDALPRRSAHTGPDRSCSRAQGSLASDPAAHSRWHPSPSVPRCRCQWESVTRWVEWT